jgi:hypothetical protein
MRYHYLLILTLLAAFTKASSIFLQAPLGVQQQAELEEEFYDNVNTFLNPKNPDDAEKNCNACINLLKITKRFCYFPERIQLAVMSNTCKRSKQVDNEVVCVYYKCKYKVDLIE